MSLLSNSGQLITSLKVFQWYKKGDEYLSLSFPQGELYTPPSRSKAQQKRSFTWLYSHQRTKKLKSCRKRLTDSPIFSPRSAATLSETAIADILLGWVHIILQAAPLAASISDSKIYCGSCVVFPQPVSPETTITYKTQFPPKLTTQ